MKNLSFKIILFLISVSVYGQVHIGEWQDYLCYADVHSVEKVNSIVYAAAEMGLISYDLDEYVMTKLSKVSGLSDIDITAIKKIPDTDKLFIGYENGNIDILEGQSVENIPDLVMKSMLNSKTINNVYFYNNMAYCSTDFGILVVNVSDLEIDEFYYIGDDATDLQINAITVASDSFFVATAEGLKKAAANSKLLSFYETWQSVDVFSNEISDVLTVDDDLLVAEVSGNNTNIYKYYDGNASLLTTVSNFMKIEEIDKGYAIVTSDEIYLYNSNDILQQTIADYAIEDQSFTRSFSSLVQVDDDYYIGDSNGGLISYNGADDDQILPSGPYSNKCFKLKATSGALWTLAGNFKHQSPTAAQASRLKENEWSYFTRSTTDEFSGLYNICDIAIDPRNEEHVYLASYFSGVIELNGDTVSHLYNDTNSGLQEVNIWELVGGICLDDDGNLYANNQEVGTPIVVKPDDVQETDPDNLEWYQYDYMPYDDPDDECWLKDMIYTDWGDIWAVSSTETAGIFVFNTNGTIEDDSDDTYRSPNSGFTDSRHTQIKIWDDEGSEIEGTPQCIVKDKNNYIWIGLSEGLVVYYQPRTVFDYDVPVASMVSVPRNDGSGYADNLLDGISVTAIEVDGANRKWIGTENDGLFLVSADGTNVVESFTASDSPLPSDYITSISVNPSTGEVFIGTDAGIVSYMGTATEGEENYSTVKVYPNPVRPSYNGVITIEGLVENSLVKITDISGNIVYEATSTGGTCVWDGCNFHGRKVKTGVYLVFANDDSDDDDVMSMVQKIMIVR